VPRTASRAAPKSGRGIGDPPARLADDEAACWREFITNASAGVLTGHDRCLLKMGARGLLRIAAPERMNWPHLSL
jgi:hypothetical protein